MEDNERKLEPVNLSIQRTGYTVREHTCNGLMTTSYLQPITHNTFLLNSPS